MKNFVRHIKLIYRLIFFDINEKKFLLKNKSFKNEIKKKNKKKQNVLIQGLNDYYYLFYYKNLISKKFSNGAFERVGLWPYLYLPIRISIKPLENLKIIYNNFFLYLLKRKWSILYKSIGINKIEDLSFDISDDFRKYATIKKKENLLKLKVDKILVGDLIYDTYIRYRASPVINIKDRFLYCYINKIKGCLKNLNNLSLKYNFKFFFTSYSSYLHHGLPARFFLFKTSTIVYSGKNSIQYNQKLTKKHYLHTYNYQKFFKQKFLPKDKKFSFKKIKKILDEKYVGNVDERIKNSYMVTNPYSNKKYLNYYEDYKKLKDIDGVLFTQSIYDSPHSWGTMLFNDYYDWIISSLNYIRKKKLKIAIKPHPNSIKKQPDIKNLFVELKRRYNDLIWFDEKLSNKLIFQNIKFGVSATGTILFDLAWHDVVPISCGQSPYSYFNFTHNAKTKEQYYKFLLTGNKLKTKKTKKNKLALFYFYQNFSNFDDIELGIRNHKTKKIDFKNSACLNKFN